MLRVLFLLLIPTAGFSAETNIAKQVTVDLQLVIYGAVLLLPIFLTLKRHYKSKVLKYKDLTNSLSTQLDEAQSQASRSSEKISRLQAESVELAEKLKDSQIREYRAKELLNTKNKKATANYSPEIPKKGPQIITADSKKNPSVKTIEAWIFEPDLLQHGSPNTQEILRQLKVGSLLPILPKQINTDFRAYQVVTEDGHVLALLKNNISTQLGSTVEFSYLATIISMRGTLRRNFQCKMSIALRPVDLSHIRIKGNLPAIKQPVKPKHKPLIAEERAKLGWKPPVEQQIATIAEGDFEKNKEALEIQVAGVTFPNKDGSSRQEALRHLAIGDRVRVIAEPDNLHHKNAFMVISSFGQIGYLPRSLADNLSKKNKSQFEAKIQGIGASRKGSLGTRILLSPHSEGDSSGQHFPHTEQNRWTRVTTKPLNTPKLRQTEARGDDGDYFDRREYDYDPDVEERDALGLDEEADRGLDFSYIDDSDYDRY